MTRKTKSSLAVTAVSVTILGLLPAYLEAFTIYGPSDAPTLLLGDSIIVNKAAYALHLPYTNIRVISTGKPNRGDLVSFRVPKLGTLGIKRIAALPGETIEIHENVIIINGVKLAYNPKPAADFEWVPAVHHLGSEIAIEKGLGMNHYLTYSPNGSPVRNFPPTAIPPGHYFLLGDHRDNSNDSRMFGPVSEDVILGKVILNLNPKPKP